MGKLENMQRQLGERVGASFGVGQEVRVLPPGMNAADARPVPARDQGVTRSKNAIEVPVDRIQPDPAQPREDFDEASLDRLAESMLARGQLQPIRVRWDESRGAYIVVAGERRWRAAVKAGLATLSCVVHDKALEPAELLALQLVENALREDLKPVEQAKAYQRLMMLNGWSANQLAKELSIPQPTVAQVLALLKLPDDVQARVDTGLLPARTAYEVSQLGNAEEQRAVADQVVAEGLTREQAVQVVRARKAGRPAPTMAAARREVKLDNGTKVTVSGPDATSIETTVAALRLAAKRLQTQQRAAAKDQTAGRGEAA